MSYINKYMQGLSSFTGMMGGGGQGGGGGGNTSGAVEHAVKPSLATKMSGYGNDIADILSMYGSISGDNDSVETAAIIQNVSNVSGVVGSEMDKDMEGGAKMVAGYYTGDYGMMSEGAGQAMDNGTSIGEVEGNTGARANFMNGVNFKAMYGMRYTGVGDKKPKKKCKGRKP